MSGPAEPASAAGGDIIADLVHQFSDPFAFYRELIQNSIDAGSTRIEVTLRHQPGAPKGLTTARVADWGEGMDRAVIERYLLTKFRSSKEGDLTKIGKFGIGFLSVFAPAPDLVTVDTGRNGEDWRLLFLPDLSYELLRSPEPCEGTAVTLHKAMTASEYHDFAARSEAAVRRWCRHSEADVTFAAGTAAGVPSAAASVRAPFAVEAPFQAEYRDAHSWIVAGFSRREPPLVGFYNRGLTLLEAAEALVPGVTFKVVSDHLEHTLTRDDIRRDRHFERLLAQVRRLAEGALREQLPEALAALAATPQPGANYEALLGHAERLVSAKQLDADRVSVPTTRGHASVGELRRSVGQRGALLWANAASAVTEALEGAGTPVLRVPDENPSALLSAAKRLSGTDRVLPAERAFAVAVELRASAPPTDGRPPPDAALVEALAGLLAQLTRRAPEVALAELHGAARHAAWGLFAAPGAPEPVGACLHPPLRDTKGRRLCLNAAHPRIAVARQLAAHAPSLAALLLARLIGVSDASLGDTADEKLTLAALERVGA